MWNGDIDVNNLENGYGVYFSAANIQQIAPNPPATMLVLSSHYVKLTHLRKHCYIQKCLCITHGMRVENHLNNANEENQLTETWHI
ncbi:unnamed protein product [Onchocerca flexuosa]|uniref:Fe2OG dioxygenase domain-containing protein n=1 Tax=Onchocerca flexuosa TaxID=387005 RepID=A0A183H416_9BILA|nr:unnamed protein product [Onchocerca flexuosa]